MIAVKLGIRTSDIRNLRPANFNWEQHLVSFTQVKTGEPINRVHRYCANTFVRTILIYQNAAMTSCLQIRKGKS